MTVEKSGNRKDYALDAYPIGSGGFADVHAAKHKPTGRRVAFKKLRDGVRHSKERFDREIAVMRQLSHANIMPLLDADAQGQWYVMPLGDDSLTNLARTLDEAALAECFVQIASGLAHAHNANLVHRDVTPNNILRIRDEAGVRWVVADWGLVRRPPGETGDFVTKGGLGTEGFAAPETWTAGHTVDRRADVYSLGRVIAWALTRNPPVPNIDLPAPGKWRAIVAKMTAHERTDRHDNVDSVLSDLESIALHASSADQLIALGPDVIGEGDLIEVSGRDWLITLHRIVVGDEVALLRFSDGFAELLPHDRYVILERHGEGRPLASPPRLNRKGTAWEVRLSVDARYPRPHVDSLHPDVSLEDMSTIGGREQLPQIFLIALSTERGELPGSPDWGTHVRRRFAELGDTPTFERVVSLEAMRQASIPFVEDDNASATPLRCVERIISLKLSSGQDVEHRKAHIVADVNGMGHWEGEVEIPVVRSLPEKILLPSVDLAARTRLRQVAKEQISIANSDSSEGRFLPTIANLSSKGGSPVQPLLWMFVARFSSNAASPSTRAEQHDALTNALVREDADYQRETRWPRVLRLPDVHAEHLPNGAVAWRHAYRTGAVNEVGDEQLSLDRDGRLSFQRATFWDVETPALDFGMLAFDCIVFMRLAGRYTMTFGARSLDFDVRVCAPQGANEVLALFHSGPIAPEQPDRTGRLRRSTARGNVVVPPGSLEELDQLVSASKRLLDAVANEFELEPSTFSRGGPPFLAIDSKSLAALAKRFR